MELGTQRKQIVCVLKTPQTGRMGNLELVVFKAGTDHKCWDFVCQVKRMNREIGAELNREIGGINRKYMSNLIRNSIN